MTSDDSKKGPKGLRDRLGSLSVGDAAELLVMARQRIRDALTSGQAATAAKAQRGVGVGLVIGGAIPLGVGVGFLANYGRLGADFQTYGGWMQTGVVLLGVGAAVDVVGLIVAATAGPSGGQHLLSIVLLHIPNFCLVTCALSSMLI